MYRPKVSAVFRIYYLENIPRYIVLLSGDNFICSFFMPAYSITFPFIYSNFSYRLADLYESVVTKGDF